MTCYIFFSIYIMMWHATSFVYTTKSNIIISLYYRDTMVHYDMHLGERELI